MHRYFSSACQPTLLRYFATCARVVVTWLRFTSPCSNRGPTILSQSMNRLISLPMKPFLPYIAHVTTVLSPAGLKVKSTVATPSIGRFQSMRSRTSSPGLLSMMVADPAPTSLLPSQLQTAPTPESGPLKVFFTLESSFTNGFHATNL